MAPLSRAGASRKPISDSLRKLARIIPEHTFESGEQMLAIARGVAVPIAE
jgi:hypothetical protein